MKTYKCPNCKKEQEIKNKKEFEHKESCILFGSQDDLPENDFLVRVWKPTNIIIK